MDTAAPDNENLKSLTLLYVEDDEIPTVESLSLLDVSNLLSRIGEDVDFAKELLDLSLSHLPLILKKLRITLAGSDDMNSIFLQAHTLKGAASNISALALCAVCLRVETAAEDGDMKTVLALMPELEKTLEMTVEAIGKISLTGIKNDNGG